MLTHGRLNAFVHGSTSERSQEKLLLALLAFLHSFSLYRQALIGLTFSFVEVDLREELVDLFPSQALCAQVGGVLLALDLAERELLISAAS